ncbi:MAG: DUF1326 domain-containing protein [Acidobacteria bacterium]|nr:DUF1326 domain-containing protein [Acidobacteriota bacterium]
MRKLTLVLSFCCLAVLASTASAQQIYGDYIESRNADVWTGHCFAMGEINLAGDQAILAWRVSKGEWNGVKLDGLSVVGVARAEGTLGNHFESSQPAAKAVLIVDEKATPAQREALTSFAREMGGDLFKEIVSSVTAPISIEVDYHHEHPNGGRMQAGELATIVARTITAKDRICGHEQTYYPPLTATKHAMPFAASIDQFKGDGLGVTWTLHDKRSAFVGNFAR